MKHKHFIFFSKLLTAFAMVFFLSCSKKESAIEQHSGKLKLNMGISVARYDVYNHLKAADLNSFLITIYNQLDEIVAQYNGADLVPDIIELPEGSYYATAHSNNNLPAEFDNPYYFGSTENFLIVAGQTISSSLTCTLANIMITIVYSERVRESFTDYSTSVSNTASSLSFDMNETRAGFFNEGPLHIESNLYYQDGSGNILTKNISGNITDAEAGKHYEIQIDVSQVDGNAILNLVVDESYETELIVLNDEESGMSGEILITEIMYNPSSLSDTDGEFIEIKNISGEAINLRDLVLRRGSNNDIHVIAEDLFLLPEEIALLGRSDIACDTVDYVYTNISLLNSGDELYINTYGTDGTDGSVICMIDYGAPGFITSLNGISIQLNPGISDVKDALLGINWCESTISYSTGDIGSPGSENEICP